MTIALSAVEIKHERRLRLIFSQALAAGAFVTSLYVITSLDDAGAAPEVSEAFLVTSNPAVVELALDSDLQRGGLYEITAEGVPAVDLTVTADGTSSQFRYGISAPREDVEPAKRDRDRLLYGVDLLWNGVDYQETSNGDLERVGGTANVTKALYRNVESNGLPWDPTWGVGVREFVDSPSAASGSLKGQMSRQLLRDPRVRSVKVTVEFDDEDRTFLHAVPTLITGEPAQRVSLVVPSDS